MIDITDLKTRFGSDELIALSDRKNHEVINTKVINEAISDATEEVASYLMPTGLVKFNDTGVVYVGTAGVPTALPKSLFNRICNITRYYLHDDNPTVTVEKRYTQAVEWLKQVKKDPAMLTGIDTDDEGKQTANSGICVMPNPVPSIYD